METNATPIYHLLTQPKLIETLNPFLPLLGVIIGSFLTIVGGIYLRKMGTKEERHKLLREKLEELCLQLYELDKWVSNAGRIAVSFGAGKISPTKGTPVEDSPIVRIDMLVRFYFHSLRSYSDPLSAAVENFRKTLFNFYADILEGKQKPGDNRYWELIGIPAQEIEKLRLQLLKELEKEVRKYI
jgi:hypothetical protein